MSGEAWEPDKRSEGGSGESGNFPKIEYFHIKDKESADIRFLTEPLRKWVHMIPVKGKNYPAVCIGSSPQECPAHQAGQKAKRVMASLVLDRRDGKIKLYEFSNRSLEKIKAVKNTVAKLRPELSNPTMFDIQISRTGTTKDNTNYSMTLGANMAPLTDAEKALPRPNLEEYYKENSERMETLLKGDVPKRKEPDGQEVAVQSGNPLETEDP